MAEVKETNKETFDRVKYEIKEEIKEKGRWIKDHKKVIKRVIIGGIAFYGVAWYRGYKSGTGFAERVSGWNSDRIDRLMYLVGEKSGLSEDKIKMFDRVSECIETAGYEETLEAIRNGL